MGRERPHVPYRNSMMTLVLKDSLGGNCRTSMIANITLEKIHIDESISTCRFAQRVAMIFNEVRTAVASVREPSLVNLTGRRANMSLGMLRNVGDVTNKSRHEGQSAGWPDPRIRCSFPKHSSGQHLGMS